MQPIWRTALEHRPTVTIGNGSYPIAFSTERQTRPAVFFFFQFFLFGRTIVSATRAQFSLPSHPGRIQRPCWCRIEHRLTSKQNRGLKTWKERKILRTSHDISIFFFTPYFLLRVAFFTLQGSPVASDTVPATSHRGCGAQPRLAPATHFCLIGTRVSPLRPPAGKHASLTASHLAHGKRPTPPPPRKKHPICILHEFFVATIMPRHKLQRESIAPIITCNNPVSFKPTSLPLSDPPEIPGPGWGRPVAGFAFPAFSSGQKQGRKALCLAAQPRVKKIVDRPVRPRCMPGHIMHTLPASHSLPVIGSSVQVEACLQQWNALLSP